MDENFKVNPVKQKLKNNDLVIGSWSVLPSLEVVEIMAQSGFEFIVIDLEHGPSNWETVQRLCMVCDLHSVCPFVRVSSVNPYEIRKALDFGAKGIVVPNVSNNLEVETIVNAVYYPPIGNRGAGLSRAQRYGDSFKEYYEWSLENLCIILQIESYKAINNMNYMDMDHIDAAMIGPYDLSASIGQAGRFDTKEFAFCLDSFKSECKNKNIPMSYHLVSPDKEELHNKINEGYKLIAYGVDEVFLSSGCSSALQHLE